MDEALQLLRQEQWRLIDQTSLGIHFDALQSFGMDDALCELVGSGRSPATARAWVHHDTVVLGIQDTKLPLLEAGLDYLDSIGYKYIVRNSGGLAVVLDEGVLNLSLIIPDTERGIDINRGYDAMLLLIRQMFADFNQEIEAREIVGSYCPGSYDLSIGGKKFAGISQRRMKRGVAVQVYLSVTDSGSARAEIIKEFYARTGKELQQKYAYPNISPAVMASLSELFGSPLSIQDVMLRFLQALQQNSTHLYSSPLNPKEVPLFEQYYLRVAERNRKILGEEKAAL